MRKRQRQKLIKQWLEREAVLRGILGPAVDGMRLTRYCAGRNGVSLAFEDPNAPPVTMRWTMRVLDADGNEIPEPT